MSTFFYLVEVKSLQAEGVQEPGEGALAVVGEDDHLQTRGEQGLISQQHVLLVSPPTSHVTDG